MSPTSPAKLRYFRFSGLLTRQGWMQPAYVGLDASGVIASLSDQKPAGIGGIEDVRGFAIPGFHNAHSHAFQYAMAGLAEHLPDGAAGDDFWSWRESMYRLAQRVTPEQVQNIATMLYAEMLRFGITSVVEFHYLHHGPDGRPYADLAEMGSRLVAAAEAAGIQLTLVPIFYQRGGFKQKASAAQSRFLSRTADDYMKLVDATRRIATGHEDVLVGVGVHSLRAVTPEDIVAVLKGPLIGPAHLHVAEQQKEVDECREHLGARPVDWLLDHLPLDRRFNLVHATHIDPDETTRLAKSGATVVLCPSTEGNLGDGFFPLTPYLAAGGQYAFGTDSHIGINPLEELRWLDYGQRLRLEKRNIVCARGGEDSGRVIFDAAWQGGRRAAGLPDGDYFAVGRPLDAAVLDPEHPVLAGRPPERLLAALIYGGDASAFSGTMRRGEWIVKAGRHIRDLKSSFLKTLATLR